jgi:6-phosphogluconolactonase
MADGRVNGAVFVQTNEPTNRVLAFRRAEDGTLTHAGSFETGGAGEGEPHLPSQGSVILSGDGQFLLVANAASNDVAVFAVVGDAQLQLLGRTAAGEAPKSIAEHDHLVYVLSTGRPGVIGFRLTDGGLELVPDGAAILPGAESDPAQVGFTPDGAALLVTDRGTNSIVTFPVSADGTLAAPPQVIPSCGPTPYGFAFAGTSVLVVTEAFGAEKGAAAASSYSVQDGRLPPVTRSAGNGRSEICWAVVTPDGRYAFTTNFADGAVSRYAIAADGTLTVDDPAAGLTVDGRPGLRDEDITADGRYLYAVDADSGSIFGWAVGRQGELTSVGVWDGLPTTIAGLAAR